MSNRARLNARSVLRVSLIVVAVILSALAGVCSPALAQMDSPLPTPLPTPTATVVPPGPTPDAPPWALILGILSVIVSVVVSLYVGFRRGGKGTLLAAASAIAGQLVFAAEKWAHDYLILDADADGVPDGRQKMEWVLTSGYDSLPVEARAQIEALAALFHVQPRALLQTLAQEAFDKAKTTLDQWMAGQPAGHSIRRPHIA